MRPPYFTFRPLRSGIAIINPVVDQYGTLGFFGRSGDGATWMVSCYHVLCRVDFSGYVPGEQVYQPDDHVDPRPVAVLTPDRSDVTIDCAAARILDGVVAVNEILGLGPIDPNPVLARVGMRALKYGSATELTEGIVTAVRGAEVEIQPPPGYSREYSLSAVGDSGALWIEQRTLRPVALHKKGSTSGVETAVASSLDAVLRSLDLNFGLGG